MSNAQINKYLRKNLFLALPINMVTTFIFVEIVYNNKSNRLEGNQAILLVGLGAAFWAFILTSCSATILFNSYASIRKNTIYSFLSFYFIPIIAVIIMGINIGKGEMLTVFFVACLPFFITQAYFFLKFRKALEKLLSLPNPLHNANQP